jgi:phosphohistidine phosphatase SixA
MKTLLGMLFMLIQFTIFPSCITHYYISRHAEKQCEQCDPCGLTNVGMARANALRDTLIKKNIDTIFTSSCLRTRLTAKPLAKALHKTTTTYPDDINTFIENLKSFHTNVSILVVSHSPQIPIIVKALADKELSGENNEYGKLFHITKMTFMQTHISFEITDFGNP